MIDLSLSRSHAKRRKKPPTWEEIELWATLCLIALGVWLIAFLVTETVRLSLLLFG